MGRNVPHVIHGYSQRKIFILKKEVERLLFLFLKYKSIDLHSEKFRFRG